MAKQLRYSARGIKHSCYGVVPGLIVPGTTIGVSLIPGYVEIRDKGVVKKKIPTKHRSFYAVLEEVEMYFRARRKMLPPSTLKDVLIRIGLPEAKKIVTKEDVEVAKDEIEKPKKTPASEELVTEAVAPKESMDPVDEQEPVKEVSATGDDLPKKPAELEILSSDDFQDIEEALSAVESLSDTFMAPQSKEEKSETKPVGVKVSLKGASEVVSASSSFATAPINTEMDSGPQEDIHDEVPDVNETEIDEAELIDEEELGSIGEVEGVAEKLEKSITEVSEDEQIESEEEAMQPDISWSVTQLEMKTPAHVVKPLVASKILILGEDGVGKSSLMNKAGLELTEMDGDLADKDPFVQSKVFETDNHRVKAQVWSFDDAVRSKVSRKEFYSNPEVLIIVYSASDRWSFESINFWLKEATITQERIPPIVIVGNKMDLVRESIEDTGDEPVTNEEGFALAEELAKRFGAEDKLHQVAYIGTSCLTEEGVIDVFRTAAQLAANLKE